MLFQVVPYQEIIRGAALFSCKKVFKNYFAILFFLCQSYVNWMHLQLWHEIFAHSCLCGNSLHFEKRNRFFINESPLTVLLTFSKSSVKIKIRLRGTYFVILLTSSVISKQKPFHGNEIVQYFQNYRCYEIDQDYFRKHV